MQRIRHFVWLIALIVSYGDGGRTNGEPPLDTAVTYQGRLSFDGIAVNASADSQFTLWDAAGTGSPPTGGTMIGSTQNVTNINVTDGLFTVLLNATGEFGATPFGPDKRWLQVAVRSPAGGGNYVTLSPRQPLTPSPQALYAKNAGTLTLPFTAIGNTSATLLSVENDGSGKAIYASSSSGPALYGVIGAGSKAVYGEQSEFGNKGWLGGVTDGVHGESVVGSGVYGKTTHNAGAGVIGETAMPNGQGVLGLNMGTTGTANGVQGITASNSGRGVFGIAAALNGATYGVQGLCISPTGIGVLGSAQSATGTNYGVYGRTSSAITGYGVYCEGPFRATGQATFDSHVSAAQVSASNISAQSYSGDGANLMHLYAGHVEGSPLSLMGIQAGQAVIEGGNYSSVDGSCGVIGWAGSEGDTFGVFGDSSSSSGAGVLGRDFNNVGVWGEGGDVGVYGVGDTYGVYGDLTGPTGLAMYSDGDMHVNGMLFKNGGMFKIDHPLDPENAYLQHSFVESPDMMNIYNGNVVTDSVGEAWVELPRYFETVNKDFRYQLTVIGRFARAIVAQEIADNRFLIRTDEPNVKVSWQVTGVRRDPWAEQHRIVPELEKREEHRGKYLNPELYGQPEEKGIHYRPHAAVRTPSVSAGPERSRR